jgi:hypothetical protein
MDPVLRDLGSLANDDDVMARCQEFVAAWKQAGLGAESIAPIIHFMEEHPGYDYGSPGPLVHYVEHFRSPLHAQAVEASLGRKPTAHVLWMLNRLINGQKGGSERSRLVEVLRTAHAHPLADGDARRAAAGFLAHHGVVV